MTGPTISVILPYRGIPKQFVLEGYGALDELRGQAIRYLDKMKPKDRERIPFYVDGKRDGILYYHDDVFYQGYVYENSRYLYTLYKNGSFKTMKRK